MDDRIILGLAVILVYGLIQACCVICTRSVFEHHAWLTIKNILQWFIREFTKHGPMFICALWVACPVVTGIAYLILGADSGLLAQVKKSTFACGGLAWLLFLIAIISAYINHRYIVPWLIKVWQQLSLMQ